LFENKPSGNPALNMGEIKISAKLHETVSRNQRLFEKFRKSSFFHIVAIS
jgi:hypothetical protein